MSPNSSLPMLSIGPTFSHSPAVNEDHGLAALMNPGEAENFFASEGLTPFDPSAAAGFNRNPAMWLAEFCRLIYRQELDELPHRPAGFRTRAQIVAEHGWREATVLRSGQGVPQAAVFERTNPDGAVIVFRGTLGLRDMFTDLQLVLRPWAGAGHVPQGFKDAHAALWPALKQQLHALRRPIFLTGHSLGGALATMTAALCRTELPSLDIAALYTFGSPRAGDRVFGAALRSVPHFRVVNDLDVIPRLPPVILNSVLPFFQHTGQLHHVVDGNLQIFPSGADPFASVITMTKLSELRSLLASSVGPVGKLPPFLTHHAPVNYVAKLEHAATTG